MSTDAGKTDYQALLKEGYRQLKAMRSKLDAMERQRSEPIAVVGIGCRFPGGGSGPAGFWRMLQEGVDATREVPADRWDVDAYYADDPDRPGTMYVRRGAFLDEVDRFDPEFFNIWPREAASMDPQQRLLLEVAWEAIEDAGIPHDALAGRAGGVYVGVMFHDYAHLVASAGLQHVDTHFGTGNGVAFLAGRLSHQLGLTGPSLVVDTACSSSLVTVHLACQSLRSGETDVALAGGVNLILSPLSSVVMCRLRALAPDGRCKTFDAAADGYARGEGCGMVVLKRLSDAVAGGDRIWAVIRGSAVNQDGAGAGLTVPNGLAQQAVIRQAMAGAKVSPQQVGYVEAHGTGTRLGDPLELRSLWSVFRQNRDAGSPIVVGALKTNVGHMEGAAGIGSLIKTVLAVRHGRIPPHLHLRQLNPMIVEEGIPLQIPDTVMDWPGIEGERVAGVSSFGMSGTNAHVIVGQGPAPAPADDTGRPEVLCLSARTPEDLRAVAGRYRQWLAGERAERLADACYTAAVGRRHWPHRLAVVAADRRSCAERLGAWLDGKAEAGVFEGGRTDGGAVSPADPSQVARAYAGGADLDWSAIYGGRDCRKVSLPTYPFRRQRCWVDLPAEAPQRLGEAVEGLLYEIRWHEQEASAARPANAVRLVVAAESGLESDLVCELQNKTADGCVLGLTQVGRFEGWLQEAAAGAAGRRVEVVFVADEAGESDDATALGAAGERIAESLLRVMQGVVKIGAARLWVVTRSVQAVGADAAVRPAGATAWGLGKVFSLEHPDLWGGLIDLPAAHSPRDGEWVLAEMAGESGEEQVAWRDGRRYVARLEPIDRPLPAREASFDPAGVYWIAGGLGAVGLQTAAWMVRRGARHLVLQGRRGLPPREAWASADVDDGTRKKIEGVQRLESLGATVHVVAADVADAGFVSQAKALLEKIERPLRGVVHAAGVSQLRSLAEMTPEDLRAVLASKVRGLANLHEVARAFPGALLVCFSSIASAWGSQALGHYAAANQFMDAFVQWRRGQGMPGLSINWGPLAGGGMDLERQEQRLGRIGIRTLSSGRVGAVLERLLTGDAAQVVAADVDWAVFRPVYEAQRTRRLLEHLGGKETKAQVAGTSDRQRLLAGPGSQEERVEAYLLEQVAAVLKAEASQLEAAESLTSLGVDSLMAMELQKRLEGQAGVDVSVSQLLQGATLRELAASVAEQLAEPTTGEDAGGEIMEGEL